MHCNLGIFYWTITDVLGHMLLIIYYQSIWEGQSSQKSDCGVNNAHCLCAIWLNEALHVACLDLVVASLPHPWINEAMHMWVGSTTTYHVWNVLHVWISSLLHYVPHHCHWIFDGCKLWWILGCCTPTKQTHWFYISIHHMNTICSIAHNDLYMWLATSYTTRLVLVSLAWMNQGTDIWSKYHHLDETV